MAHDIHLHTAQATVLKELLFVSDMNFASLQRASGLSSDHFKFHIRKLTDLGFVQKTVSGEYALTPRGKEFANKLDTDKTVLERQPKSAVILVIERRQKGSSFFLLQQRKKHPYFGFWGFPGGKIRWGETILQAGERELFEETGLTVELTHRGVYHEHAVSREENEVLEDKIFHILYGLNPLGDLVPDFDSGSNHWMTLAEAAECDSRYASLDIEAGIGLGRETYIEATQVYGREQF